MLSIFGLYFVSGLMQEAGWPRRQGFFRKEVLDTTILDSAIDQMIDWAAALGAGRPSLALQTIAEIFRDRDWKSEDAPSIKRFIESARTENEDGRVADVIAPRDFVLPTRFAEAGSTLDAKALKDEQMRMGLETWFLWGVLWGFANPKAFEKWYQARYGHQTENLEFMRRAGLEIEAVADFSQFLADSEELLRSYERDIGPLPAIPDKLLADAQALGRHM